MREDCSNCNFLYDLFPVSSNYCLGFPVLYCVIYCMHVSVVHTVQLLCSVTLFVYVLLRVYSYLESQ